MDSGSLDAVDELRRPSTEDWIAAFSSWVVGVLILVAIVWTVVNLRRL